MKITEHALKKTLLRMETRIPRTLLERAEIEVIETVSQDMVIRLETYLGELTQKPKEVRRQVSKFTIPKSWWQHFKEDYFPNWLLQHYPVDYEVVDKTTTVYLNSSKFCPHVEMSNECLTFLCHE